MNLCLACGRQLRAEWSCLLFFLAHFLWLKHLPTCATYYLSTPKCTCAVLMCLFLEVSSANQPWHLITSPDLLFTCSRNRHWTFQGKRCMLLPLRCLDLGQKSLWFHKATKHSGKKGFQAKVNSPGLARRLLVGPRIWYGSKEIKKEICFSVFKNMTTVPTIRKP